MVFSYYRLGKVINEESKADKITIALFLIFNVPGSYDGLFKDDWIAHWERDKKSKINFVQQSIPEFAISDIFPFHGLSDHIENTTFILSHLNLPHLYVRVRPFKKQMVLTKLKAARIPFVVQNNCITLRNGTPVQNHVTLNEEVVIQDKSSQNVATYLSILDFKQKELVSVWDCCAGSGGKSILVFDCIKQKINLTATDIRTSIIQNLHRRFKEAGLKKYHAYVADATKPILHNKKFDLVICDVPCTGSGTWGRSPEHLQFHTNEKTDYYVQIQQRITINAFKHVLEGGYFLYITCSVFKAENESMVEFILNNSNLQLVKWEYFKGYETKADTLFAALFIA